jgi:iron complex outermembrane receptor protein
MKFTSLFLVLGLVASPVMASAADPSSPDRPVPADQVRDANKGGTVEDETRLEEVTVTATRRQESVQKVPISINAIGQDELNAGSIKDIGDIASVTPGLQFGNLAFASTLTLISIRGLDSLFGASTVGIYLDDTPIQGGFPRMATLATRIRRCST